MANLTTQLFGAFSNPETDPQGTDSRTQGDENFRAIASSLKLTFPNLDDVACDKSGAQLNDTTEAGATETVTGSWTFTVAATFTASTPVVLDLAGNQTINKTGAGELRLNTENGAVVARPDGVDTLSVAANATTATGTLTVTGTTTAAVVNGTDINASNDITATNNVTAQNNLIATNAVSAGGNIAAGGYVSMDSLRHQDIKTGLTGIGDTTNTYIELYDATGTLIGRIPVV